MMNTVYLFSAFVIAFVFSFASTPLVKKLAFKIGAIDVPKDNRRMHKKPIPRLGGLAIIFGFVVAVICFSESYSKELIATLTAGAVIVVMGVVDDCKDLNAKLKFVIQIIAALIVIYFGDIKISVTTHPNIFGLTPYWVLPEWLSVVATVIWIVFITNAVNFIDGLDGLAAGVSAIMSVSLVFIAVRMNEFAIALMGISLMGGCFGFLPYNFNPAKIFMGDTGSLALGATMGTIAILTHRELTLLVVAGIFVIETLSVIIQTFWVQVLHKKLFLMTPLHHHFEKLGWQETDIVKLFWVCGLILSMAGIIFGVWL